MAISINRIPQTQALIKRKIEVSLEAVGLFVVGEAKERVHVDTENLRSSLVHELELENNKVIIGTNVEYAVEEEFRAGEKIGFGKHEFLRPAAEDNIQKIIDIFKSYLESIGGS